MQKNGSLVSKELGLKIDWEVALTGIGVRSTFIETTWA